VCHAFLCAGSFCGAFKLNVMSAKTHDVENQVPPIEPYDPYAYDAVLRDAAERWCTEAARTRIAALGVTAGTAESARLGFEANEHPPELHTHDRYGHRIDEVRFHPSWHALLQTAIGNGLHASPWRETAPDAHFERAAKFYLWAQVEAGHGCPVSMTYAAVPALRHAPELAALVEPRFAARAYEPELRWIGDKQGALCGMGMTEKHGGSDVRANTSRAVFAERSELGDAYLLAGHKWFCSAPMSDAFLVTAQTEKGPGCFFLPRILPDGSRNAFFIQRLKDKLGNRSNASSEIEFADAYAWRVGEEGRGIPVIAEMVNSTRLDCINGSAACMRQAVLQAVHHASYRRAFAKRLIEHPLMENVLADLALESMAATLLTFRLAHAADGGEPALRRLGTAAGKYWVCKRTPAVVAEALEVLGGNGYVEESVMPRLYREAPLNSIWEGSGNINALDVLRIVRKDPDAFEAFAAEIAPALDDRATRAYWDETRARFADPAALEAGARSVVERLALLWQAALMRRYMTPAVADAFVASRIARQRGEAFGTLPPGSGAAAIIESFGGARGAIAV